jgi:serine/threonine protein phosphatase 1
MLNKLRKLVGAQSARPAPTLPEGQRVYAIGDIHGELGLLTALVEEIERDDAERGEAQTTIILLGDLVDRGPDSAGVITFARNLADRRKVRILFGNHEEMFLQATENTDVMRAFLRYGGMETLLSYPLDTAAWHSASISEAQGLMCTAVPQADFDYLRTFEDIIILGDYLFVHAGIAPDVPIESQSRVALRWMREPFLSHTGDHGFIVVHGHTITEEADVRTNRIGVDTGAYQSGRLTALALEGQSRWLLTAERADGHIKCKMHSI